MSNFQTDKNHKDDKLILNEEKRKSTKDILKISTSSEYQKDQILREIVEIMKTN